MKKRTLSVVTYFVLNLFVLSSLIISTPTVALACEDEPPQTLLQLYKSADTIYIATYGKLTKGELVTREEDDYRFYPTKRHFDISQTLKGEPRKMFALEGEEYFYETPETAVPEGESEVEHPEENTEIAGASDAPAEGDTVMLFLNKDPENPDKLVTAHYRDAIKKLSADSVGSYEKRVRELNAIFTAKKASDTKVVDWLVRLAEDPATRWEGTFELSQAFMNYEWITVETERRIKTGEEPMSEEELAYYANSAYASLLTPGHKQRLSDILLSLDAGAHEGEPKPSFGKGDLELVELVKRWGDTQTASFFLDKLRSGAYTAEENSQMMTTAAGILRDAKLQELASEYMDAAWRGDDEPVDAEEPAADPAPAEGDVVVETPSEAADAVGEVKAETKRPVTYKERRDSIVASFLARAAAVIANADRTVATRK